MPIPAGQRPTAAMARNYALGALKEAAKLKCNTRDCGTVCLCLGCSARYALPFYDAGHPDHHLVTSFGGRPIPLESGQQIKTRLSCI